MLVFPQASAISRNIGAFFGEFRERAAAVDTLGPDGYRASQEFEK